ncbi:MAG: ABC transporter ATP-binding protein [Chloroflexota bacterium]|nr:ABC transporter ATP-binding protein [Chloroflexota bacterium]
MTAQRLAILEKCVVEDNLGRIEAQQLTKRFNRKLEAVRGINLDVALGEIYGLIGPDGAGKTTTIRMLAGVMKPTAGVARVNGYDTSRDAERLRHDVGYMAQRFTLYGDLSVRENIEFYADIFGVRGEDRDKQILRLLQFARLEQFQDRDADVLSGGMKKKLGLACALIHRPKVLFLDEPTNGVDPISRREFWDILSELHIRGVTIFVSTAYMDEAERCSRVGLMYQGKIISEGSPASLRQLVQGDLLAVEASDLQTAETIVKTLDGVLEVQVYGDRLHVFVKDCPECRLQIEAALNAAGLENIKIRAALPRLEEAFISLVTHQG